MEIESLLTIQATSVLPLAKSDDVSTRVFRLLLVSATLFITPPTTCQRQLVLVKASHLEEQANRKHGRAHRCDTGAPACQPAVSKACVFLCPAFFLADHLRQVCPLQLGRSQVPNAYSQVCCTSCCVHSVRRWSLLSSNLGSHVFGLSNTRCSSQKPRDFSLDRADKSENLSSIYYYPRGADSRVRPIMILSSGSYSPPADSANCSDLLRRAHSLFRKP